MKLYIYIYHYEYNTMIYDKNLNKETSGIDNGSGAMWLKSKIVSSWCRVRSEEELRESEW